MNTKVSFGKSMKAAAIAALAAMILNAVFFYIFKAAGVITDDIEVTPGQPMTIVPVLISSVLPTFIAGIVFFLFERFTKRGFLIFTIVSVVLLLLSFGSPFMNIPKVTMAYGIVLNLMHVVVAGALLFFIRKETSKISS